MKDGMGPAKVTSSLKVLSTLKLTFLRELKTVNELVNMPRTINHQGNLIHIVRTHPTHGMAPFKTLRRIAC